MNLQYQLTLATGIEVSVTCVWRQTNQTYTTLENTTYKDYLA